MTSCRAIFPSQIIDVAEEKFASLMDDGGEIREDIKLPEGDLGKEIQSRLGKGDELNVTLLSACGTEMIVAYKNAKVGPN